MTISKKTSAAPFHIKDGNPKRARIRTLSISIGWIRGYRYFPINTAAFCVLPMTPRISARYHWQDARADVLSFKESHCHAGATIPQTDIYQDPAK